MLSILKSLLICNFYLLQITPQEILNLSKITLNHVGVHVLAKKAGSEVLET